MIGRLPRATLFPYTTLFRSDELVGSALELGYEALALTDHNSVSGSMEFAVAANALGLRAIHGAEIDLDDGRHLELLRSEEHTSELQSRQYLVCRLLLEKKKE